MLLEKDFQIAPCLRESPIANSAQAAVIATRNLGIGRAASVIRAWCVPYLFEGMETIFASGEEPTKGIKHLLDRLTEFVDIAVESGYCKLGSNYKGGRRQLILKM